MRLLKHLWLLFILLILAAPLPISAQNTADTVTETFTLYGLTHTLSHPSVMTGFPGNLNDIYTAITAAVNYYDEKWQAVTPRLWLEIRPSDEVRSPEGHIAQAAEMITDVPSPGQGVTHTTRQDVCRIRIFWNRQLRDSEVLHYVLSHEVAHCYQGYLIPSVGHNGFPSDSALRQFDNWWIEGSADWLALHVPGTTTPGSYVSRRLTAFFQTHRNNLIRAVHSYDGVFFWESLENSLGLRGALDVLTNIPLYPSDQETYFGRRGDIDQLFSNFALSAARAELPNQQPGDDISEVVVFTATSPQAIASVPMDKFAIKPFFIPRPTELGSDLEVTVTGLTDSGTTLKLLNGSLFSDGVAMHLCGLRGDRLDFVASRADKGTADTFTITVARYTCPTPTPTPSPTPTPIPTPTEQPFGSCYYGTWQLVTLPQIQGVQMTFEGVVQITLERGGAASLTYEDFAITTEAGGHTIKVVLNGHLTNTVMIDDHGHATGTPVNGLDSLVAVSTIDDNPGPEIDIGNYMQSMGGGGAINDARLECAGDQLKEYVNSSVMPDPYIFQRQ